jgi:hypothetical protein
MDPDSLFALSDLTTEEFQSFKDQHKDDDKKILRFVLSRSVLPNIRNIQKPPGDMYTPIYYDRDILITLVKKAHWGGYVLFLTTWDMLIIDIDNEDEEDEEQALDYIKKNVAKYYPNDLFYINKTTRGYHLYLVSRTLDFSSKAAIYMRQKLGSDPAHGTNSLYTGSSIRLSKKQREVDSNITVISKFLCKVGDGVESQECLDLYRKIQNEIEYYSQCSSMINSDDFPPLADRWRRLLQSKKGDMGMQQILATAPLLFDSHDPHDSHDSSPSYNNSLLLHNEKTSRDWSRFIKSRVATETNLMSLLIEVRRQMAYNNLYRILESTPDYAVGLHCQESLYFMVFRDLLFVDYDYGNRLQIVYQYCRYHPEATFRIVKTNKGYHCFLTSYPVEFTDKKCLPLLRRLCSDPCHYLGVFYRGYSVRINKKSKNEPGYREVAIVGKAAEDPRLVSLYHKHLEYYQAFAAKVGMHNSQLKHTERILEEDGPQRVW